ncbi:MAG: glycosyltransferase family 4 protein [Patescibacteria group bacterium]|jgi:glycosyltransferase involved in cell wall biosynthesis
MMQNKDTLVIVTPDHSLGCAGQTIQIFAKELAKKGRDVKVFFLDSIGYDALQHYVETNKVRTILTNSIYFDDGEKYNNAVQFLKYCKKRSIQVIDIAHFGKFDPTVDALLYKRLFVSQTLLLKYCLIAQKNGFSIERYDYLYNPLDLKLPASPSGGFTLDFSSSTKKFFTVGRIGRANKDKWDDAIIKIAPYVLKRIPNCRFIVRSLPDDYRTRIPHQLLEKFTILPETTNRKEIVKTIRACDVLLQTSQIGESFGCAIAEGMALGKPIITNSTDFLAPVFFDRDNAQVELVEDTMNGFVENTPEKMAQRIIELYNNRSLYEKISRANIQKARELFNTEKLTNRLEGFLGGNIDSGQFLPLPLSEYKNRLKKEPLLAIIKLNFHYLLRRMKRKLTHVGLLECC